VGKKQFNGLDSLVRLVNRLLDGHVLTADVIAAELGIKHAAAARRMKLLGTLNGTVKDKIDRRPALKMVTLPGMTEIDSHQVVTACLLSSLAPVLRDTALRPSVEKLRSQLLARSRKYHRTKDADRKFWFVARGGERALPKAGPELIAIIEAILESRWITFAYEDFEGRPKQVKARPLTLAVHEHQFYVIASPEEGPAFYPYRFARMNRIEEKRKFDYPSTAEYDPQNVFRHAFGIFIDNKAPIEDVHLRLSARFRHYVTSHRWHESQQQRELPDGSVDLTLQVRPCDELVRWVLWFGPDAEVIAPRSLREKVSDLTKRAAANYATPMPTIRRARVRARSDDRTTLS
jgi:predicted DNA-binding transcriptional regulator YafY